MKPEPTAMPKAVEDCHALDGFPVSGDPLPGDHVGWVRGPIANPTAPARCWVTAQNRRAVTQPTLPAEIIFGFQQGG